MRTHSKYSECDIFAHLRENTHEILHLCRNSNLYQEHFLTYGDIQCGTFDALPRQGEHFCVQVTLPPSDYFMRKGLRTKMTVWLMLNTIVACLHSCRLN